jgi:two-component system sensor kinase FixL
MLRQDEFDADADAAAELEAVLSAAVDGIIVIDTDGRICEFNAAAERLFGYDRAEVKGQYVEILMPEPYRSHHRNYMERYAATGQARVIGIGREVEGRRSDGSSFPIWLSIGEAQTYRGLHFVGIVRDLTDQRAAARKQAELEDRLDHVARLSLIGEMAAGVAHEINQPLSAIATYSQAGRRLLEANDCSIDEMKVLCSRIAEQAHRAGSVIENLRSFVRKQEVKKEIIDPNGVIDDVMSLILADAKNADLNVRVEFSEHVPHVNANAVQLQQVVLNLTRNAVDSMRDAKHRERGIVIKTETTPDGAVKIAVIDHGAGVAKGLGEAVFHPFVSTKSYGLGIGLAISRTIVESFGGKLSHRPNPQGGAIFEIVIPSDVEGPDHVK